MRLSDYVAEVTEYDFKLSLETDKPKSWLKSVSAFANGIGGTLFFGVRNDGTPEGLADIQRTAEKISEFVVARITPLPDFKLEAIKEGEADVLCLKVSSGLNTPYYYKADGITTAYIRAGNESIPAPEHVLNELILKGQNKTYDSSITTYKRSDYSFTLMEATYLQRTGVKFDQKDYVSFGLADKYGMLTVAGALLADQHIIYNSRVFATRWNGLKKGSIFDDAIDDKEFEGNLIQLLNNSCDFIKNNSRVRFKKDERFRVDKPDYAERAITETMVNALIHRQYLHQGTEIHIDMFDDRVEITSPGGMFEGGDIQSKDIEEITSARRNPIIADLFHRMRYMERRGSGLHKIVETTKALPGYSENHMPQFVSTDSSFKVVLKNVNYNANSAIETANSAIDVQGSAIEAANSAIESRLAELKITKGRKSKITLLYCTFGETKTFGRSDVADCCGLSYSTAGDLIKKMHQNGLITSIDGEGKGRYRFNI